MTFSPDWPAGAVATFAASALAGLVSLVSLIVSLVDRVVARRRLTESDRRSQWWDRWSFTVDRALSDDPARRRVGAALIAVLVEISSVTDDDRRMAEAVADALSESVQVPDTEEDADGPRVLRSRDQPDPAAGGGDDSETARRI